MIIGYFYLELASEIEPIIYLFFPGAGADYLFFPGCRSRLLSNRLRDIGPYFDAIVPEPVIYIRLWILGGGKYCTVSVVTSV